MFKIIGICLGRNAINKHVTLDAYVVNSINPICMEGASAFTKKLEKKGYNLADDRLVRSKSDTVEVDLLIGADNYTNFVSPKYQKHKFMACG